MRRNPFVLARRNRNSLLRRWPRGVVRRGGFDRLVTNEQDCQRGDGDESRADRRDDRDEPPARNPPAVAFDDSDTVAIDAHMAMILIHRRC